ncbi:MAG: hypothetical protein BM556_07635 [Bacteriovorax sp. MedPE-SWde]|nr:MAG: hypothetical protein BM556_07635 [Bacteriovorax sp. MedPE-SWde]
MKKLLILIFMAFPIMASETIKDAIIMAMNENPGGFFEDRSGSRPKNLGLAKDMAGQLRVKIEVDSSGTKNFVSNIISTLDDIRDVDHIKKSDRQRHADIKMTFTGVDGKKHEVKCSATQEYECGRLSLIGCWGKDGITVGPSGQDHNFRYFYNEHLASDEQCYKQSIQTRRKQYRGGEEVTPSEYTESPSRSSER